MFSAACDESSFERAARRSVHAQGLGVAVFRSARFDPLAYGLFMIQQSDGSYWITFGRDVGWE